MYLFWSLNNIMKSEVWILVISITEMKKLQNWMMSWESHFAKKDKLYLSWKNCFVSRFHHYLKLRLSKLLNTNIPHLEINNNTTSQDQVAQWLSAYQSKDSGLILGIPWRRKRQFTPIFLPGKSQGQRSPEGYNTWGHKDRTWLSDWAHSIHTGF